jgi:hypothetical protein
MTDLVQLPEWLGAALIGAVLAALGYVAKSALELWTAARRRSEARRAALIELHSLLRASGVTFRIQNGHARRLLQMVQRNHPEEVRGAVGYEGHFARAHSRFNAEEKELHSIIRSMTTTVLRPTNQAILEWLRRDTFYKSEPPSARAAGRLPELLSHLEAHLILWHAKYEAWIPDHPEHALVYLDDEKRHGLGFPTGIDDVVAELAGLAPRSPATPDPRTDPRGLASEDPPTDDLGGAR